MQTVNRLASPTSVASSNNPSIFGPAVTFTATVTSSATSIPTGTVTFQDGAATLGTGMLSGGNATLATSALVGGVHSITAVYGGGGSFARSTSPSLTPTGGGLSPFASPPPAAGPGPARPTHPHTPPPP